jgi:hypothetical protein
MKTKIVADSKLEFAPHPLRSHFNQWFILYNPNKLFPGASFTFQVISRNINPIFVKIFLLHVLFSATPAVTAVASCFVYILKKAFCYKSQRSQRVWQKIEHVVRKIGQKLALYFMK